MTEQLKVALIGYGAVARLHFEAYRILTDVAVTAVSDTREASLEAARVATGATCYSSVTQMLREESLDIACVLTPPATHEALVLECAAAGVHVLCEKPMAVSLEACERMVEFCRSRGVRLCYGASYRYLPAIIRAREIIQAGDLGDIVVLRESAVGGRGVEHRKTLGDTHYPRNGPGGSGMGLVDHGIHLIDAFGWMLNSPVRRVFGRGNVSGQPQGPEFAVLEYDNAALGFLLYENGTFSTDLPHDGLFSWGGGWDVEGPTQAGAWNAHPGCIHVHGTRGALRIFHYANALYQRSAAGMRQLAVEDRPAPLNFAAQLQAFVDAIRSGRETPVPGEVGTEACRILLQMYSSDD